MRGTGPIVASLAVVFLLAPLAGCAAQRVIYDKPGATQAARERDEADCLRAAVAAEYGRGVIFMPYCVDRDAYARCMESRGYTGHAE